MAIDFYLNRGHSPKTKTLNIAEGASVLAWSPTTSTRIVVTNVSLVSSGVNTSIAFYWGDTGGSKIAEFLLAGSVSISPAIGCWACTAYDRGLYAKLKAGATDGFVVNLTGFELK